MKYLVPILVDAGRNPVGLFSMHTTSGPVVLIFSSTAKWNRFTDAVAPVLAKQGQFIGSTTFQAGSLDEVAAELLKMDPSLDGSAEFVPDTAPILDDVVAFFEQNA